MTITLNLKPEVEADLLAQAQAAGVQIEEFLSRQLEVLTQVASVVPMPPQVPGSPDQWEQGLDEWLDSFPQNPVLSGEALKRENWYPDRW